jgi:acetylornithine/succinyldiaminopimelate/putrescine aminotransferase
LSIRSHWPAHATESFDPIDAHRCTVQLSTGRLYLDAVASPTTALLGHDFPPLTATDGTTVKQMLCSLEPGYVCLEMMRSFSAAAEFAARLGRSSTHANGRITQVNALEPELAPDDDWLVAHENETLGRTGRWLASAAWSRPPDLVVVGEALALGEPFGAVLAYGRSASRLDRSGRSSEGISCHSPRPQAEQRQAATMAALERVAAAIGTVGNDGLLEHGDELASYLRSRLMAMRASCPSMERVDGTGLALRIGFAPPVRATQIRRRMCERGVLTGVDSEGRLAIDPPLAMRIAEIDVIIGALRASIIGLPLVNASACCAACRGTD